MNTRYLVFLIPLILFAALITFLGIGLNRDPKYVPSPLIGKPLPTFSLPELENPENITSNETLKGQVSLLNVWASWCVACRIEHPFLMQLAEQNTLPIYGFNYRDQRDNALRWLDRHGNPYRLNAHDLTGRAGIDLGVYGAPETFLIDKQGKIAYKQIGPITPEVWQETLAPLIEKLRLETNKP